MILFYQSNKINYGCITGQGKLVSIGERQEITYLSLIGWELKLSYTKYIIFNNINHSLDSLSVHGNMTHITGCSKSGTAMAMPVVAVATTV